MEPSSTPARSSWKAAKSFGVPVLLSFVGGISDRASTEKKTTRRRRSMTRLRGLYIAAMSRVGEVVDKTVMVE